MQWQEIKAALCASRDFTAVDGGFRVLADTMMPSGMLIYVHMHLRNDTLMMHDGGAAFDELSLNGAECKSTAPVRRLLAETNFTLTPEGKILRDGFLPEQVGVGLALVADASQRAAQYMLANSKVRVGQPLDVRVRNTLRQRFPDGMQNYSFRGAARQQTFDFGIEQNGQVILVDAVSPDMSSVNAAIVKSLDAKQAAGSHARPILVYDETMGWSSEAMNLLAMAGERMSFARVAEGRLLAA